jgi:hypothetical protein
MRLMLLTALAVWIAFNLLFVVWMRWMAGAALTDEPIPLG